MTKISGLASAVEALRRPGGVVFYPTGTVYGLGGSALDGLSARRIAVLKGRSLQPMIVLVDGIPEGLSVQARALAEAFWPGPVTLLVDAIPGIAPEVLGADGRVALRWSAHPVVEALVREVGPITSTSANRSGEPPNRDGHCSLEVDAVLSVGHLGVSPPSSLVDVSRGVLLREGALALELREYLLTQ